MTQAILHRPPKAANHISAVTKKNLRTTVTVLYHYQTKKIGEMLTLFRK